MYSHGSLRVAAHGVWIRVPGAERLAIPFKYVHSVSRLNNTAAFSKPTSDTRVEEKRNDGVTQEMEVIACRWSTFFDLDSYYTLSIFCFAL